ncbi:pilus assembly protein N-terminal domain-containing protein [Xanthobacter sp. V13C-7B]|uniref:pilus assembly protein N-terminal domain-containing protein n=1 Tax=Xanthobacter variabilis TaxID=3119932 RepID=UPI003727D39D
MLGLLGLAVVVEAHAAEVAAPAMRGEIVATVDQARAFTLDRGARVVAVGNPAIADATVTRTDQGALVVLTGKSYGSTNVVVVGEGGQILADARVSVRRTDRGVVTVHSGAKQRVSFECTPVCAPVASLGDDTDAFGAVHGQMQQRQSAAGGR